jgi:hypothetical protein
VVIPIPATVERLVQAWKVWDELRAMAETEGRPWPTLEEDCERLLQVERRRLAR